MASHIYSIRFYSLLILGIVSSISTILSCTYKPSDVYFRYLQKPTQGNAVISLNNMTNVDTIVVSQTTGFSYSVISTGASILRSTVTLSGTVISSSQYGDGSFQIISQPSMSGTYATLQIDVTTLSNSGSLASTVQAESIDTWHTWVVHYLTPPVVPTLSRTTKNGFFALSWPSLPAAYKTSFTDFTLSITAPYQKSFIITDFNATSFVDSIYLEGIQKTYQLTVHLNKGSIQVSSDPYTIYEPIHAKASFNTTDSMLTAQWPKSKYTSACGGVLVQFNHDNVGFYAVADTTVTKKVNLTFGKAAEVSLYYYIKYPRVYANLSQTSVTINNPLAEGKLYFGQTPYNGVYLTANNLFYSKVHDEFIINMTDNILRFANLTQHTKDSMQISPGLRSNLPYPGNYYYTSYIQLNLGTNKSTNIPPSGAYFYKGADNQYYSTTQGVYDLTTGTAINPQGLDLSDDGKLGMSGGMPGAINVYSLTSNPQASVAIPINYGNPFFRPDNSAEIYDYELGKMSILSSADGTLKRQYIMTTTSELIDYDPISHYFLFFDYQYGIVTVLNIDTGLQKQINVSAANCAALLNGYLFLKDGSYLKLF